MEGQQTHNILLPCQYPIRILNISDVQGKYQHGGNPISGQT